MGERVSVSGACGKKEEVKRRGGFSEVTMTGRKISVKKKGGGLEDSTTHMGAEGTNE